MLKVYKCVKIVAMKISVPCIPISHCHCSVLFSIAEYSLANPHPGQRWRPEHLTNRSQVIVVSGQFMKIYKTVLNFYYFMSISTSFITACYISVLGAQSVRLMFWQLMFAVVKIQVRPKFDDKSYKSLHQAKMNVSILAGTPHVFEKYYPISF